MHQIPPGSTQRTITIEGEQVDATVMPMTTEDVTFVTFDYHGRTFRFSATGAEAPYEVAYQHEFPRPDPETGERQVAWFPTSPVVDDGPMPLQTYVRAQVVALHRDAHAIDRVLAQHP